MHIETKFNIGDKVFICQKNGKYERETCKICNGKGHVVINDKSFQCPECYGMKQTNSKYIINDTTIIIRGPMLDNLLPIINMEIIVRIHNILSTILLFSFMSFKRIGK